MFIYIYIRVCRGGFCFVFIWANLVFGLSGFFDLESNESRPRGVKKVGFILVRARFFLELISPARVTTGSINIKIYFTRNRDS